MNHFEGDNIGSLAKVEIVEHYKIKQSSPMVLTPGAAWLNIPFKEQSGRLYLKTESSVNGTIYTYSGTFFIHNIRNEVSDIMDPFVRESAVLRLTDMNGKIYIIGGFDSPVVISELSDTGQKFTNENGTLYEFSKNQPERAVSA